MTRSMRRRFRKILLASTLAVLGATESTNAQETTPIHATTKQETFHDGAEVILGYAGDDDNVAVFSNLDAMIKFYEALDKSAETKDVGVFTRTTIDLLNSGESHHYKSGTPCTVIKSISHDSGPVVCVVLIEGKKWITLGKLLHLPGTTKPVKATLQETKVAPPVSSGLTHHNSESGLAGKPCLLVKSKLFDHTVATFR